MKIIFTQLIVCILVFTLHTIVSAQTISFTCGWKQATPPDFRLSKKQKPDSKDKDELLTQKTDNDLVYTLPVVVHVINTGTPIGAPDNPTNAQIHALIKNLNNSYRKKNSAYGGVDMKLQFALATNSPTCGATNGIVRVDGSSVPNYSSGGITNINYPGSADETLIKGLSDWPNTDYINIWIVNKINGSATSPGGYTYFPEYNTALTDGLVILASVVDSTNKTVVHEMGHFFSLYHPFHDGGDETTCALNDDCTTEGDDVCDTEVELNVACGTSSNSCNNNLPFMIADTSKGYTVLNNYMGYTNCQLMFTQGQKTRARNALFAFRYGLINSKALSTPGGATPKLACIPTAVHGLSPYYGVEKVEFNTLSVYSNSSEADGSNYIDRSCNQSTTVKQGKSYTLKITGSYENPQSIKVFIDYNNDGIFSGKAETLMSVNKGIFSKKITIPTTGVVTGVPLRMRVIADNPALPVPSACRLHGTKADGAGQIEDYSVIIMPATPAKISSFSEDQSDVAQSIISVYPDPAHDMVNIIFYSDEAEDVDISFLDQSGHRLGSKMVHCNAGKNFVKWDVHSFAPGIYYIFFGKNNWKSIKVVKE